MPFVITELAGQGVDTVRTAVNHTLQANVEVLTQLAASSSSGVRRPGASCASGRRHG
jgi:hypothetical protein